jgi:hypothetical protein
MSDDILKEHLDYKPLLKQIKGDKLEDLKSDYCVFTMNYFKTLTNKTVPVYEKLRLALYCEYMIRFHLQRGPIKQPAEKIAKFTNIGLYFVDNFLNTFAEVKTTQNGQTHYNKTKTLKEMLIYYILVVAFMLHDYKLNIGPLAKSLELHVYQLKIYCLKIGCYIDENKKKEDIVIATLKAPLKIKSYDK